MRDIFNLQGRVALFTGASQGLGKFMAVVGRHHDQNVLDRITAAGQAGRFYEFDLANPDAIAGWGGRPSTHSTARKATELFLDSHSYP